MVTVKLGLLVKLLLLTAALLLVAAQTASAQDPLYIEMVDRERVDGSWPEDCSSWQQIHPNFGIIHHQDAYEDDGNGEIDACEHIILDGDRYHVEWVGPTYHLVQPGTRNTKMVEPTVSPDGRNPICETWHEIHPDFCLDWHVEGWEDNGDGVVSECDWVFIGGQMWHIEDIGLNMIVNPASPVQHSTWSRIKQAWSDIWE